MGIDLKRLMGAARLDEALRTARRRKRRSGRGRPAAGTAIERHHLLEQQLTRS